MAEDSPRDSARPDVALALWIHGIDPPPTLTPNQDRLGAEIYLRALGLHSVEGEPRFPPASASTRPAASDVYAVAAVIARQAREGTQTDVDGALTEAMTRLGETRPEVESPSVWVIGNALLIEAYRYEVLRDDRLMWSMANRAFTGDTAGYDLHAIHELCQLAKSRSTPRARQRWALLDYEVLQGLGNLIPAEQFPLDHRFDAISDYADVALPASSPAPAEWITVATMETLRDLNRFLASGHPTFDIWIGSVLRICDALMATRRLDDCRRILRLANDVVDKCGPGGPTAREPDMPSPRREDAEFLLELLDTTPEVGAA